MPKGNKKRGEKCENMKSWNIKTQSNNNNNKANIKINKEPRNIHPFKKAWKFPQIPSLFYLDRYIHQK